MEIREDGKEEGKKGRERKSGTKGGEGRVEIS